MHVTVNAAYIWFFCHFLVVLNLKVLNRNDNMVICKQWINLFVCVHMWYTLQVYKDFEETVNLYEPIWVDRDYWQYVST